MLNGPAKSGWPAAAAAVVGVVPKWPLRRLGWLAGPAALLGQQPFRGEFQRVGVAAGAVVSGHEVVADHE